MGGNKVAIRNAVTVGEDQILSPGLQDCPVEYLAFTKTILGLPDMINHQPFPLPKGFQQQRDLRGRSIISHDQFEAPLRLQAIAPEHFRQPLWLIRGRDNDGRAHELTRGFGQAARTPRGGRGR